MFSLGYMCNLIPGKSDRRVGIWIFYKSVLASYYSKSDSIEIYTLFENMYCTIDIDNVPVKCYITYCPINLNKKSSEAQILFDKVLV